MAIIKENGGSLENIGFLQWSHGALTKKYFGVQSIQEVKPGVVRHPEMSYFRETVYDEKANLQNRLALFTV